ncbi:hypothetical protein [Nocardia amikacinitolerans]|uniref:hypothetical protein n=1 Tax=Nocardia amikacinitolerans TaxID=756689 RepID=UPI0020A3D1CE|nr:hypothetical protein [Nocardia amikacinitolerans]MCP2291902.1 Mce-associated membrane protein [Nocardia amikacinitolerans]
MTQNNGDTHRTRRRAGRPAGPPVEETGTSGVTVKSPAVVLVAKSQSVTPKPATSEPAEAEPSAEVTAGAPVAEDAVVAEKVALSKESPVEPEKDAADVSAAADDPVDSKPKLGVGRIVALAATAVLVVALMVGAGVTVFLVHNNTVREDRRAEYLQAARQAVLNLTTIRADSAKEDIERILATASGKFKNEFDGRVDPFMEVVKQAKVVSTGEVVEAALVRDDEESAIVLIAAKQTLTNAGSAEPQTRFYRFRITVTRTDSGLSASNVEFVA